MFFGAVFVLMKMGMTGLRDSYLMFLMPFAPSICFERVFYIYFFEDFQKPCATNERSSLSVVVFSRGVALVDLTSF